MDFRKINNPIGSKEFELWLFFMRHNPHGRRHTRFGYFYDVWILLCLTDTCQILLLVYLTICKVS